MQSPTLHNVVAMDSFHIYLPSNACQHIYPGNTPTDYQTRIDQTIDLGGEWEVGVESIVYDSQIDDKNVKENILCNIETQKVSPANDHFPFKFVLDENGKWKGFDGVKPTKFEEDPAKLEGVIKTLNAMNSQIFEKNETGFTFHKVAFSKASTLKDFSLKLTPRLTKLLGYGNIILSGEGDVLAFDSYRKPGEGKLTAEDYMLKYFCSDVQERKERIELKPFAQSFDGKESTLLKLWQSKVKLKIVMRFSNHKLIIDNYLVDIAIVFSPDLGKAIGHKLLIIGKGTTWGSRKVNLFEGHTNESWYIDIYSTELSSLRKEIHNHRLALDIYPWQYETMEKVMDYMNQEVKKAIEKQVKTSYDSQQHQFTLSLNERGYSDLALGRGLDIHLSKNLSHLFAFNDTALRNPGSRSVRRVSTLKNRQRQLLLLCNIAKTTAYGRQHLQILQSFLHEPKPNKPFIEKHFKPIMYVPLLTNSVDRIQLQLAEDDYAPINITDSKTLVCLIFRKVREKTMM